LIDTDAIASGSTRTSCDGARNTIDVQEAAARSANTPLIAKVIGGRRADVREIHI